LRARATEGGNDALSEAAECTPTIHHRRLNNRRRSKFVCCFTELAEEQEFQPSDKSLYRRKAMALSREKVKAKCVLSRGNGVLFKLLAPTFLAFATVVASAASASPVVDNIDWPSFLARHDAVWAFSGNATTGYSALPATIATGVGAPCAAPACASAAECVERSASACDACATCASFSLSAEWHNGTLAQMFTAGEVLVPNSAWTTWRKGGAALPNHSSWSAPAAATAWEDGTFFGDGLSGGILRVAGEHALVIDFARADIWDRRAAGSPYAIGQVMWDRPRLPVGFVTLATVGAITAGGWRLRLLNASIAGSLETAAGSVSFELFASVATGVTIFTWRADGGEAPGTDGCGGFAASWTSVRGNSTRSTTAPPANYQPNPEPECAGSDSGWGGVRLCAQDLLAGAGYATAFETVPVGDAGYATLWATANDWPTNTSRASAAALVAASAAALAAPGGLDAARAAHSAWWAAFWPVSFLSVPDTAVEAMWVMQLYKLGCAVRASAAGGVAMDLMGPWWQRSGWELYWWDSK